MQVLVIDGHISQSDIAPLCSRARVLANRADADDPVVYCDVAALRDPDALCVEALARVRLTLKRLGCEVRFWRVSQELRELIDLFGLCDVLPCASVFEVGREAEEREHPGRI